MACKNPECPFYNSTSDPSNCTLDEPCGCDDKEVYQGAYWCEIK